MALTLIRACQSPHGEFDPAIGQLAPVFDSGHIGLLREPLEEGSRSPAGLLAGLDKVLTDESVIKPAPHTLLRHAVGQVPRRLRHRADTPDKAMVSRS